MDFIVTIIIAILSGGVSAAIISALMQKQNEKESRIFDARLEAYREFATHLESRFTSLTNNGKDLNLLLLAQVSAKCLLLSSTYLNKELKVFLVNTSDAYEKYSSFNYSEKDVKEIYDRLWSEAEKIEELMREDLGFE